MNKGIILHITNNSPPSEIPEIIYLIGRSTVSQNEVSISAFQLQLSKMCFMFISLIIEFMGGKICIARYNM